MLIKKAEAHEKNLGTYAFFLFAECCAIGFNCAAVASVPGSNENCLDTAANTFSLFPKLETRFRLAMVTLLIGFTGAVLDAAGRQTYFYCCLFTSKNAAASSAALGSTAQTPAGAEPLLPAQRSDRSRATVSPSGHSS